MSVSTVTKAMAAREAREQEELEERRLSLKAQLSTIAIRDLAGELTAEDEANVPELLDELEWQAADYEGLLKEIQSLRKQYQKLQEETEAAKNDERLLAAARLAQHRAHAAVNAARRELSRRSYAERHANELRRLLSDQAIHHEYLFDDETGLPTEAIRQLPCEESPPLIEKKCKVCLAIFNTRDPGDDFCGTDCGRYFKKNQDDLIALGAVKLKRKPSKKGTSEDV